MNELTAHQNLSPMEVAHNLMQLEKQIKTLEEQKTILKDKLLKIMKEHDTLSLKTGSYTLSRVQKITPKVLNVEKLKEELDKRDIPYYTQETFAPSMNEVFRTLAKENQEIYENGLPGLAISESEFVMVRLTK